MLDILRAFAVLDRMEQVPLILLDSLSLGLILRSHPEELCDISICDRLSRVEKKMLHMQEALDSCVAGNLELKDKLDYSSRYSSLLKSNLQLYASNGVSNPAHKTSFQGEGSKPKLKSVNP